MDHINILNGEFLICFNTVREWRLQSVTNKRVLTAEKPFN